LVIAGYSVLEKYKTYPAENNLYIQCNEVQHGIATKSVRRFAGYMEKSMYGIILSRHCNWAVWLTFEMDY
jgi:hypothetical protein